MEDPDHENICLCRDGSQLAEEVVRQILCWTDFPTLLSCRLVCTRWNEIITDPFFWKFKCSAEGKYFPAVTADILKHLSLKVLATLYAKQPPFEKNLIRNPFALGQLQDWEVLSEADSWACENPPQGSDLVPEEAYCWDTLQGDPGCFATSYHFCSKQQLVDLREKGFIPELLDSLAVEIEVTDWYAGRFDCGCVYELQVELLDVKKNVIDSFESRQTIDQWAGREWHKVEKRFTDITGKVRYVRFFHEGTDSQYWKWFYGSKMTGSSVRIRPKQEDHS